MLGQIKPLSWAFFAEDILILTSQNRRCQLTMKCWHFILIYTCHLNHENTSTMVCHVTHTSQLRCLEVDEMLAVWRLLLLEMWFSTKPADIFNVHRDGFQSCLWQQNGIFLMRHRNSFQSCLQQQDPIPRKNDLVRNPNEVVFEPET